MFQRRNGLWAMLVALAILGLVASACQAGGPQPTSAQADPEGELILPLGTEPDTIDPQKESFVGEVAQTMLVFEPLMTFDKDSLKPVPAAAKEPPKVSADGLTYTFTLRDGLKYSDGVDVKAKDYVYAFKRLCDPEVAGEYQGTGEIVAGCADYSAADAKKTPAADLQKLRDTVGVRAVDDKTVEYKLKEKAAYFPSLMGLWIGVPTREDMVKKGGDKWTEPETFIGNGFFKLVEWKHNEKMVYERNESHNPKAKVKRIVRPIIAEAAVAFAAYKNSEIDVDGVGPEDKKVVESDPQLSKELQKAGGTCTFYYGFNTNKPPFDDPKVRLAFSKSFDRDAYLRDIQQGIGTSNMSFIPPGLPGFDDKDDTQKFDATAAKKLIEESKYKSASALPPIKFTYSSSARAKTRAEWVVGQWKQNLGVDVPLDPVDRTTYTRLVKDKATTPQLFTLGWCADYPDAYNWVHDAVSVSLARTAWKNDEFDKLVKQATAEQDDAKRADLFKQAQRVMTKDAVAGFYYSDANWYLVKPWVQGYKLTSLDYAFGIFTLGDMFVTRKNR